MKDASPAPRLSSINRNQLILRSLEIETLIEEDHSARSIWELVGRLDLSLYYSEIAAVEGQPGREHTDPSSTLESCAIQTWRSLEGF